MCHFWILHREIETITPLESNPFFELTKKPCTLSPAKGSVQLLTIVLAEVMVGF